MLTGEHASLALLTTLLLTAVWIDHKHHRIPNWLTGTTLLAGIFSQALLLGWAGTTTALLGMLAGFAIFLVPYLTKSMAAGDVKLMAAVGAFLGPQQVAIAAAGSLVAGAGVALLLVSLHYYRGSATGAPSMFAWRFPYASAIAMGTAASIYLEATQWTL